MGSDKSDRHKSSAQKPRGKCEIRWRLDEIGTSSSHYRRKAGKSQPIEKTKPSKKFHGQEDERRKAKKQTEAKQRAQIPEEQYSDEEVREKPALKPAKRKKFERESGEDLNEDKQRFARMTQDHKERVSRISDVEEKREIGTKAIESSGIITKKGKHPKADSRRRKYELAMEQKGKGTLSSDVTEEDPEDEEASSAHSQLPPSPVQPVFQPPSAQQYYCSIYAVCTVVSACCFSKFSFSCFGWPIQPATLPS